MGTGVISKTRELDSTCDEFAHPYQFFPRYEGEIFDLHPCARLPSFLKHQPWQTVNGSVKAQERRGPSVRAQLKRSMRGISHEQTLRALRAYARTGEHYRQRVFSNQPAYVIVHTNLQDPIFLADGKGKDG